jgi:hypothetical protein
MVKIAIEHKAQQTLLDNMRDKKTTQYINTQVCRVGTPHPIWGTTANTVRDVRRAAIKVKLLTGTYLVQANRARFNQHENSKCPLCEGDTENYKHFLLECPELEQTRTPFLEEMKQICSEKQWKYIQSDHSHMLQIVLDSSKFQWLLGDKIPALLEPITRRLCFKLHAQRSTLVAHRVNTLYLPNAQTHKKKKETNSTKKKPKPTSK